MLIYNDQQWRVQEYVRGGQKFKRLFFLSLFQGGGTAQKIAEKMIFPPKK